jgi:ribose/xylose/arabinose/galactoside ABC-type transport system permease subunit
VPVRPPHRHAERRHVRADLTLAGVPPLWNQFLNGTIIIVALIISRFASGEKQE